MPQPQYTQDAVHAMTDNELAGELRHWASARRFVSRGRQDQGKEPLDYHLLDEAADRLTTVIVQTQQVCPPQRLGMGRRILLALGIFFETLVRGSAPPWAE